MPLLQSGIAHLSDELTDLIEELGALASEDVLEMRKPNRHLYGSVHYFITGALDDMRDVIEAKTELERIASDAGTPVVISFELFRRTDRVWKMRLDRPPFTI